MPLFGPPNVEKMKTKRDVKGLIKALGIQNKTNIREAAAEALGDIADAQAVESLTGATKDGFSEVREAAVRALGKIGGAQAIEALSATIKIANNELKIVAVEALGMIGDAQAIEPLINALRREKYEDRFVRDAAAEALGQIGTPAVKPLLAFIKDLKGDTYNAQSAAEKALRKIGVPALAPLLAILENDYNEKVQVAGIDALGAIGDARAVEPLLFNLRSLRGKVKSAAAHALGEIGDDRAVEPLINVLLDEEAGINAARSLGKLGDVRAVGPLINSLLINGRVAADALGKIGTFAVEPLIAALQGKGERSLKAYALGVIGDVRAVEPLIEALIDENSDSKARAAIVEALGAIGDARAVGPLIEVLTDIRPLDERENVQTAAAAALGAIGDARAVEPLLASLTLKNTRMNAAKALISLYQNNLLDQMGKEKILTVRPMITSPHSDKWTGCEAFSTHSDSGIGLDFPL